jgi:hypothetical protein
MNKVASAFRIVAIACVATGLGAMALAADSAAKPRAAAGMTQSDRAEARKDMIRRRLDSAASRLEIKASQQSAWQTYAAAVQALGEADIARPAAAPDADAATIARERADRATAFASKLTAIADATVRLQGALSPEQRGVLNQLTREAGHHHRPGGFGPPMMEDRHGDDRGSKEHASQDRGRMEQPAPAAPHAESN